MTGLADILEEAWRSLRRHPLRAALSALGVAVALAAVVAVLAAEQSWQETLVRAYENLGANVIAISVPQEAKVRRRELRTEDAEAIRTGCPAAEVVGVTRGPRPLEVRAGREHASLNAYGVGPNFLRIRGWRTEVNPALPRPSPEGCWVSPFAAKYLLGEDYRKRLPAEVKLAGRALPLNGLVFPPGYVDNAGEGYLLVPVDRDRALFAGQRVAIEAWATDTRKAARQIDALLSRRLGARKVLALSTGAWRLVAEATAARSKLRLFTGLALTCILAVAVLGVASTLLANLEERTRELALRRAVGAPARRMAAEVLCESGLTCLLGGALGCLAAFLTLRFVGQWLFASSGMGYLGWIGPLPDDVARQMRLHLPWQALLVGWIACLGGALAAASVPASMAAGLHPSQALTIAPARRHGMHRALALAQLAAGVGAAVVLVALYAGLAQYSLSQWRQTSRSDVIELMTFSNAVPVERGDFEASNRRNRATYQQFWSSKDALAVVQERCRPLGRLYRHWGAEQYYGPWAKYGRQAVQVAVHGVDEGLYAHEHPQPPELVRGRSITASDSVSAARVCVLTKTLAARLFGTENPVGRQLRLNGTPFAVIGLVHWPRPEIAELGQPPYPLPPNYQVILPISAIPASWYGQIPPRLGLTLALRDPRQAEVAERTFTAAIREAAHLPPELVVRAFNAAQDGARVEHNAVLLQLRALLIGSTGFWVALVGLANLLLTSAYARTREIGLRRALGATRSSVARATLGESFWLAAAGAATGIGLADGTAFLLGRAVALPVALPASWAAVVAAGAVLTSALAALLPAVQAASIHPAEALRYE